MKRTTGQPPPDVAARGPRCIGSKAESPGGATLWQPRGGDGRDTPRVWPRSDRTRGSPQYWGGAARGGGTTGAASTGVRRLRGSWTASSSHLRRPRCRWPLRRGHRHLGRRRWDDAVQATTAQQNKAPCQLWAQDRAAWRALAPHCIVRDQMLGPVVDPLAIRTTHACRR